MEVRRARRGESPGGELSSFDGYRAIFMGNMGERTKSYSTGAQRLLAVYYLFCWWIITLRNQSITIQTSICSYALGIPKQLCGKKTNFQRSLIIWFKRANHHWSKLLNVYFCTPCIWLSSWLGSNKTRGLLSISEKGTQRGLRCSSTIYASAGSSSLWATRSREEARDVPRSVGSRVSTSGPQEPPSVPSTPALPQPAAWPPCSHTVTLV